MSGTIPAARQRIIERVVRYTRPAQRKRYPCDVRAFLRAYYRGVAEEDLKQRDLGDLAGAALAQLQLGTTRRRGRAVVRVYTPLPQRDGWSSPHTTVETVTDDTPFLVDSLQMVFAQMNLAVHLTVHPVLQVRRDRHGRLVEILPDDSTARGAQSESWQHIEIDRIVTTTQLRELERRLETVLQDVRLACTDWQPMRQKAIAIRDELQHTPTRRRDTTAAAHAFLEWMSDDHFTFLGYEEYRVERQGAKVLLKPERGALGLLRAPGSLRRQTDRIVAEELRGSLHDPEPLLISKAPTISTVHRAAYPDQISIKRFDARGRIVGEHRFIGLFTSSAYYVSPRDIPLLSDKVSRVMDAFGLAPASHDSKAVLHVLETYPRDELFQASVRELMTTVRGIVNLYERHHVRLFVRRDVFRRFYSCLLYVPRDRYSTQVRERIETLIVSAMEGTGIDSQVQLSDSALARLHILVRSRPNTKHQVEVDALEAKITEAVRTWRDRLREALIERHGEAEGLQLSKCYADAFPAAYQDEVTIAEALQDIAQLETIGADPDGMALRLTQDARQVLHLRILRKNAPLALSDALPLLENMDFRVLSERPYEIDAAGQRATWIQDCEIDYKSDAPLNPARVTELFRDAFVAVWTHRAENDGFNRLVFGAGLAWREVAVLRAYCRYLLQTGVPFSQAYMERTLARHAALARSLWQLFAARFEPSSTAARGKTIERLRRHIESSLQSVASLDEDRILRTYLAVICASVRTNFYQAHGANGYKDYISVKLASREIPELPLPKPLFEIFVYSPRFEGVHLRNGYVARGGIRWSDRREDFRTEILGLMKAQNVKNTVIVPVGAKGGFVPKRLSPSATREDTQREGIECYRSFIRGLLDITDNLVDGKVVAPADVIRHDGDDVYLVVAADKGTATFSDIANKIAAEYGFWLGDAFASGGSAGYDHKRMAITARGAWECVKRHFRELGVDIQTQAFSVAGIGDMSGDVFGNGLLRSKHIRLLAAFDHRNIFLDPAPDTTASYRERERLFKLPRSSWEDYDRKLISRGGGVFSRSAKTIRLSTQAQTMLGIKAESLPPPALVQAILRMPVDLLWNGGIGTYVKARGENNAAVGDRSNDAVRVNGAELRCRVVGEGGNLGFTQLGRIEYALAGGRINTDFIDNSAGVDCSDHEVNLKILLNAAVEKKRFTVQRRNRLLVDMTDDVSSLVLRDNYLQSQALSIGETVAKQQLDDHAHLMRSLELNGELNRALEFLPTTEELTERAQSGRGLTRPELSVLLAYSKIALYARLIESDVPEDPYLGRELERYFPRAAQRACTKFLASHRLRREIIATATANSLVNRMGPGFARSVQEDTGADAATVARAYTITREIYGARDLWAAIEALDARLIASTQYEMQLATLDLLKFATYWLLRRHPERLHIESQVLRLQPGVAELATLLPQLLRGDQRERFDRIYENLKTRGADEALAKRIASLDALYSAPDIVEVAAQGKRDIERVASVYFAIGAQLGIDWLRSQANRLESPGHWQTIALGTLRDNTYSLQRTICAQVLSPRRGGTVESLIERWLAERRTPADAALQTLTEMRSLPSTDFATLSVALQAVRRLTEV